MALIIDREWTLKKCWACGLAIEDYGPAMLVSGANEIAYLHPDCAKSVSRRLIDDLADLIDLGFKFEDG